MQTTYEGILEEDRIKWLSEMPPQDHPVRVQVTIIGEPADDDEETSDRGRRMADALSRLAETNLFGDVEDPVAWQQQVRTDRPLPGREEDAA